MIWGGNVAAILDTLCVHPRALGRDTLRVGKVIESITKPGGEIKVYGPMLGMIRDKLGYQEGEFHAFGYDWRQSNVDTAADLARFIRQKVASGVEKFSIIAHSMGGIVTRLALQDSGNADLLTRLCSYVQIATPVRGSSLAYAGLKRGPTFHPLFDRIRDIITRLAPLRLHDLLDSLGGCDSMFQLLPPEDEKILRKKSGLLSDPFDHSAWPPQYQGALTRAQAVHTPIQAVPPCEHYIVLSDGLDTDYSYLVDLDFDIVDIFQQAPGDGTVCGYSARAGSADKTRVTLNAPIPHDELPNDARVFDMIVNGRWLVTAAERGAQ